MAFWLLQRYFEFLQSEKEQNLDIDIEQAGEGWCEWLTRQILYIWGLEGNQGLSSHRDHCDTKNHGPRQRTKFCTSWNDDEWWKQVNTLQFMRYSPYHQVFHFVSSTVSSVPSWTRHVYFSQNVWFHSLQWFLDEMSHKPLAFDGRSIESTV